MVKLYESGVYLVNGETLVTEAAALPGLTGKAVSREEACRGTMAYSILKAHNTSDDMEQLKLKFDSMTSHDITYVGIIQTARHDRVSPALRSDQLPQQSVRRRRHHQRG